TRLSGLQMLLTVGRIRRLRRIRQSTPDATLARLIMPTNVADCRPDKVFTPHPAMSAWCDACASYPAILCSR
ncbi:hypothetical protein, partial [Escherichia sp. E4742]|uniref:hypothetical protein n=1 Tax=Escherichia sp. E4742 TaxID=2044467 RepID=UPI00197AD227